MVIHHFVYKYGISYLNTLLFQLIYLTTGVFSSLSQGVAAFDSMPQLQLPLARSDECYPVNGIEWFGKSGSFSESVYQRIANFEKIFRPGVRTTVYFFVRNFRCG